jgi:DNA helicase II / ATP-dependent DNA helicase PcrA
MTDNFIDELNDSQRAAVTYNTGPSLVIAGAGSGKTRVLTYKIAYLLQNGLKPYNILALTFTNKAAKEMKNRIARQVGDEIASHLWMGTFHSIFSRILRAEASHLGFDSNFTIYDAADSRSLVKSIIKEMGLDEKAYKPATVAGRISMAKNNLILPDAYAKDPSLFRYDNESHMPAIRDIYQIYYDRCHTSNAMDFDDLLLFTYVLFSRFPDILKKYSDRFHFILVDEYQDTNYAQHSIVIMLTKTNQKICVVGDDAQSIYSFRGAKIDNILNFTKAYKDAKTFKLERNYRSTQRIVEAANSLISHNREQIKKQVYSKNDIGEPITIQRAYSDTEEALIVCNYIQKIRSREHCQYDDFAILYRTNSQSRSFEESMRKRNIPYRIYGGLSFYQRKEIKDVISYFRMVTNPNDEEAFKRIINYPTRGIGNTTINKIISKAQLLEVSLWEAISDINVVNLEINSGTIKKIVAFRSLIESFQSRYSKEDAYKLGFDIITESGIKDDIYCDRSPENLSRQENIDEFLSGIQDFVDSRKEEGREDEIFLSDFLQEVSLLTDLDSDKDVNTPKVTLMTIHSAKGLEFQTVFVVGVEENIFPSPMCLNSMRQIEEERRLFYVAITRAEKHCFITYAENRYRYGKMEFDSPSRFIKDIDSNLVRNIDVDSIPKSQKDTRPVFRQSMFTTEHKTTIPPSEKFKSISTTTQTSQQLNKNDNLKSKVESQLIVEGNMIEHERFGIGNVIRVEGTGENMKATVQFRHTGVKQLLLKFARFKVIG